MKSKKDWINILTNPSLIQEGDNGMKCKCINWARIDQKLITKHHRECKKYKYSVENECYNIIKSLLHGILSWANDEDGVHPELYEAFKKAACFVGEPHLIKDEKK